MGKYIDLSQTIKSGMPVHPYDEKIKLYQNKFLDRDKFNNTMLEAGMHIGTHIDAPRHLIDREELISDFSIDAFIGNGCLLDVRNETVITIKQEYNELVSENDIVLLYTGFGEKFQTKDYYSNHPVVDKQLALFFIEKKVKMIGLDIPSPDQYPFEIHKMLFENDIFIIENLTNLHQLVNENKFEVFAFPLKIHAEASLARVVAKI